MRKCPVCEEDVPDEAKSCKVCGELLGAVQKDFALSSPIEATIIPAWVIIGAISLNALFVGWWIGSMGLWGALKWYIHLHW